MLSLLEQIRHLTRIHSIIFGVFFFAIPANRCRAFSFPSVSWKVRNFSKSKPFAIVKNSGAKLTNRKIIENEMTVSHDICVYVRGLKNNE